MRFQSDAFTERIDWLTTSQWLYDWLWALYIKNLFQFLWRLHMAYFQEGFQVNILSSSRSSLYNLVSSESKNPNKAIGMCSNFVIFYVLINEHRTKSRKSASSSFVLSLCLADTFQLASLPFKMDVRLWWGCCYGLKIDPYFLLSYNLLSEPFSDKKQYAILLINFETTQRRYGKIACIFHNSVTNINLFVSGTSWSP